MIQNTCHYSSLELFTGLYVLIFSFIESFLIVDQITFERYRGAIVFQNKDINIHFPSLYFHATLFYSSSHNILISDCLYLEMFSGRFCLFHHPFCNSLSRLFRLSDLFHYFVFLKKLILVISDVMSVLNCAAYMSALFSYHLFPTN